VCAAAARGTARIRIGACRKRMWQKRKKLAEIPRKRGKGIKEEMHRANDCGAQKKSTGGFEAGFARK
jgi:hypothetical protein